MARSKRYSVEQIVAELREMERLQGQGLTIPQAPKRPRPASPAGGWFDSTTPQVGEVRLELEAPDPKSLGDGQE